MSDPAALILILPILFGVLVHGYAGFGYGIIAISLLALLPYDIERMALLSTIAGIFVMGGLIFLSRGLGRIQWKRALPILAGVTVGSPLGYLFLLHFGEAPAFKLFFGGLIFLYALVGKKLTFDGRNFPFIAGFPVGISGGFLSGAFTTGGPPMVIYLYSLIDDPREMKGTLQLIFLLGMIFRVIIVGIGPRGYSWDVLRLAVIAVPLSIPLLILSHRYSKRHHPDLFKRVVNIMIGAFGLIIITKALLQLAG